jgi:hypothetical protein
MPSSVPRAASATTIDRIALQSSRLLFNQRGKLEKKNQDAFVSMGAIMSHPVLFFSMNSTKCLRRMTTLLKHNAMFQSAASDAKALKVPVTKVSPHKVMENSFLNYS